MRRKTTTGGVPAELRDPARWKQCQDFDGTTRPCSCWWSRRQLELLADWPGGDAAAFSDFLNVVTEHPCAAPFDGASH